MSNPIVREVQRQIDAAKNRTGMIIGLPIAKIDVSYAEWLLARITQLETSLDAQKQMLDGDDEQVVELEDRITKLEATKTVLTKQAMEQQVEIAELKVEASFLLTQYSEYLEKHGYLDSDWWCEPPNAVDRFLEHLEGKADG